MMNGKNKKISAIILGILLAGTFIFFKFFFTYEKRNVFKRELSGITGQDLTVTVFDMNGRIVKRWTGIQKITTPKNGRQYIYFYTKDGSYVQIPNSVWYIAEETK